EQRLAALLRYAGTGGCRPGEIAGYFGAPLPGACGRCDNCRRKPWLRAAAAPAPATAAITAEQSARLERLRDWRLQEARTHGTWVNALLPEATLVELARVCPTDASALAALVRPTAARRYGATLLALLAEPTPEAPPDEGTAGTLENAWQRLKQFWD